MCRVLAYLGQPVLLDDLFYKPDNSLITQSYDPKMLHMLNLAGFGMLAWAPSSYEPDVPFTYRSTAVPVFDPNLKSLATKIQARSVLAHVRGVAYHSRVSISETNLHPFRFDGVRWAMAHNGDLYRFPEIKFQLLNHIKPALAQQIRGNTDSEWMYALLLSQLESPAGPVSAEEIAHAAVRMLRIVRKERERAGIDVSSPVNLFLSDGVGIVAVRFTFDYGCYPLENPSRVHEMQLRYLSLWYTTGKEYGFYEGEWKVRGGVTSADTVMIASEPLTRDVATWIEVPEYGAIYVNGTQHGARIQSFEIDA